MEFEEQIKKVATKISINKEHVNNNEESTKLVLIIYFINALGYDVSCISQIKISKM